MSADLAIRLPELNLPSTLSTTPGSSHDPRSRSELKFPKDYVVGQAPEMRALYRQMEVFAATDLPLLIQGETGAGKEPLVHTLHASSGRAGPWVAINCAAIPAELLDAELFGITKGVATGVTARDGKFKEADGGTLFLDEIGEMPRLLQAKLLRALQEREVVPLGGQPVSVDVRILAATNIDLDQSIANGAFRSDLYYRLAGATLKVPPLRQRRADIPALVEHFLWRFAEGTGKVIQGLTVAALDALCAYSWPGNVRELAYEIRKLVLVCPYGQAIGINNLPQHFHGPSPTLQGSTSDLPDDTFHLETLERNAIWKALEQCGGNQVRAAELLGISRYALRRRMERHGLETDPT